MSLVENLTIKLSNMQFVETEEGQLVHIRFSGMDNLQQINLNGYVVSTMEEFFTNSSSTEALTELVRSKVAERLGIIA
jgi:DNA-binding protein YbaB